MNTFSWPRPLSQALPIRELPTNARTDTLEKDWAMFKLAGWTTTSALVALLLWQVVATQPLIPPLVSALLLGIIGLLAGLRIGADSCLAYISDLQRNNKVLAEQQRELEDANAMLLKQISSEAPAPIKTI
jgi:hypothetical protein